MSASNNFTMLYDGTPVAVTGLSAPTPLPNTSNKGLEDVMIWNPGPYIVYARAGASDVIATAYSMPCPPGVASVFSKGDATHVAMLAPAGNQSVVLFQGNGQ